MKEFQLKTGAADYLLFIDRKVVGVIEAKPVGHIKFKTFPMLGIRTDIDGNQWHVEAIFGDSVCAVPFSNIHPAYTD